MPAPDGIKPYILVLRRQSLGKCATAGLPIFPSTIVACKRVYSSLSCQQPHQRRDCRRRLWAEAFQFLEGLRFLYSPFLRSATRSATA